MPFVVVVGEELVVGPFQDESEAAAYARNNWPESHRLVLPLSDPQEFEDGEDG